jgi:hypothetical protein
VSGREQQLRALMERDAQIFARRELDHASLIVEADRIALAKKAAETRRLIRTRQQRIAAGLTVYKPQRPSGIWTSGEHADGFRASDGKCVVCGGCIGRDRSRTCSPTCARALRAARKGFVNHKKPGGDPHSDRQRLAGAGSGADAGPGPSIRGGGNGRAALRAS